MQQATAFETTIAERQRQAEGENRKEEESDRPLHLSFYLLLMGPVLSSGGAITVSTCNLGVCDRRFIRHQAWCFS